MHGYPLADQKGVSPLEPTLDTINGLNDKKQLAALLGTLEIKDGIGGLFHLEWVRTKKTPPGRSRKPTRVVWGFRTATTTWYRNRGSKRFANNTWRT